VAISGSSVVPVCVVAFVDADDYLVRFWLTLIPPDSDFAGTFLKGTRKLFLVRIRTFHRSTMEKWSRKMDLFGSSERWTRIGCTRVWSRS